MLLRLPHTNSRVTGVFALILFLHVTVQVFIMVPYYQSTRTMEFTDLMLVLVPFNGLCTYLYYTLYACVASDPGGVPPGWKPPNRKQRRFCYKCGEFKPPRSHHCRVCKRCVLRMDHHCPWIGNCVGHGTYGHFLRFTFAVVLASGYHLVMVTLRVLDHWNRDWYMRRPTTTEAVMLVLNYLFCIPTVLMTSFLFLYHCYLLCTNTTSVESWERERVSRQVRRGLIPYTSFPFDLGCWPNVTQVLGRRVLLWPLARQPPLDGLTYPVNASDADAQYAWPPSDPYAHKRRSQPPPSSPWTYGEESLNPALRPSSADAPQTQVDAKLRNRLHIDTLPLPSPREEDEDEALYDSYDSDCDEDPPAAPGYSAHVRVRRGSEGYEVGPANYSRALWDEVGALGFPEGTAPPDPPPIEYEHGTFAAFGKYAEMEYEEDT